MDSQGLPALFDPRSQPFHSVAPSRTLKFPNNHSGDAQGVGHNGERRSHAEGGWEKTRIDHKHIRLTKQPAVGVQHCMPVIRAEPESTALMRHVFV